MFTIERKGIDSKPCLACCAFSDVCSDGVLMHTGPLPGPDEQGGAAARKPATISQATSFAYADQPACGGWFTPTINVYSRVGGAKDTPSFEPFSKLEGPCCSPWGGLCHRAPCCCGSWDRRWTYSRMDQTQLETRLRKGDLTRVHKSEHRGRGAEYSPKTDAYHAYNRFDQDLYRKNYRVDSTPQQKAAMLGAWILADYMYVATAPTPTPMPTLKPFSSSRLYIRITHDSHSSYDMRLTWT